MRWFGIVVCIESALKYSFLYILWRLSRIFQIVRPCRNDHHSATNRRYFEEHATRYLLPCLVNQPLSRPCGSVMLNAPASCAQVCSLPGRFPVWKYVLILPNAHEFLTGSDVCYNEPVSQFKSWTYNAVLTPTPSMVSN